MPLFKKNKDQEDKNMTDATDEHQVRLQFFISAIEYLLNSTKDLIVELKEKDLSTSGNNAIAGE